MKRYLYCYQTAAAFSQPVHNHAVRLRCQPHHASCVTVEQEQLLFPPGFWLRHATDAFGNRVVYGGQREPHPSLAYVSTGIVATEPYYDREGGIDRSVFLQPTPLTTLPDGVEPRGRATAATLCERVHGRLAYVPQSTTVRTSAADVWLSGKGVCQDFAHVMLALCRRQGMAARYVCGFIEGTGPTHAWVEVWADGCWVGFDPTHNRRIEYGYVKLAHGRDAADCDVSRGLYAGAATERLSTSVTLTEID